VAAPERLSDEGTTVAAGGAQNQYSLNVHTLETGSRCFL
jgi:hypothetical protein